MFTIYFVLKILPFLIINFCYLFPSFSFPPERDKLVHTTLFLFPVTPDIGWANQLQYSPPACQSHPVTPDYGMSSLCTPISPAPPPPLPQ